MLRAIIPPWQRLDDPLLHHEVRPHLRTGRRPWMVIILSNLTLLSLILYLLVILSRWDTDPILLKDMIGAVAGIIGTGLVLMIIVGHWRLLLAISSRSAAMIAQRKRRGDWDLIAITPVSKARWFRAQLTALGWQVFPLVRQLIVIQTLLLLIGFSYLVSYHYIENQNSSVFSQCVGFGCGSTSPVPTPLYALMILPFGVLLALEPIMTAGIFALVSLNISTRTRSTAMAMLYSFGGIYVTRVIMTLVLFYGGTIITILILALADGIGFIDSGLDFSEFEGDGLLLALGYCCFWALIGAFFYEWFPAIAPPFLLTDFDAAEFIIFYLTLWIVISLAYVLVPLVIMRRLARNTVWRLSLRER